MPAPDTIVLIHGLWMSPLSWEHWITRYKERGYNVIAPAWPGMEGDIEQLRADPTPIAELTVKKILDHYDRIVRDLPSPPIIMGHSAGGALTQILLDRGLGAAGVAIDSATVRGVLPLPLSTLRVTVPVLRDPRNRNKAVPITPDQFHYAFCNTMSYTDSLAAYNRYQVPAAGHVLFEAAVANLNPRTPIRVDFKNDDRAPLLFIAGGEDHIFPIHVNKANYRKYDKSSAITEFKAFAGRPHFTAGAPGWDEVADFALDWAIKHTTPEGTHTPTLKVDH